MNIYFPPVEPEWDDDRDVVKFYAILDRKTVVCLISVEALMMHFGAIGMTPQESLRAFRTHRAKIEQIASEKFQRGQKKPIDELLLRSSDFETRSTNATSTIGQDIDQPFSKRVVGALKENPWLLSGIIEANFVLEYDLVKPGTHVDAEWNPIPGPNGELLAQLTLTDVETSASVKQLYSGDDLSNLSYARFSVLRLWDDLLRKKGKKQMERVQKAGVSGE